MKNNLLAKFKESIFAVLPITLIVILITSTIVPISSNLIIQFTFSALVLIIGLSLFTLGADLAMLPIGQKIGAFLSKKNKVLLLLVSSFILGIIITIAEPDLSVLANQVGSINPWTLILAVSIGVGTFLMIALLRTLFKVPLKYILLISYAIIFILAIFVPSDMLALSFDAGSVTTGPISVPFIMAFGVGLAQVRSAKNENTSSDESFGMIAMSSAGPIIAVMLIGIIMNPTNLQASQTTITEANTIGEMLLNYFASVPHYMLEVFIILAPILVFFLFFQFFGLKLPFKEIAKILFGMIYTFIGISLFLSAVNFGFLPIGSLLGQEIMGLDYRWILVPICAVIGLFMVLAEPAVHVLNKQVEDITSGVISRKTMFIALCVGVCLSLVMVAIRVLTGISLLYFIVPLYIINFILAFIVSPVFSGIAFDSGGVTTGAMATTFVLPLAMGAVSAVGGNVFIDGFGTLALIACTPILAVLVIGLIYKIATEKNKRKASTEHARIEIIEFER
ncbi:MAG: DUF1538 domain-containing protein [Clostridia bacterium]|nr:DUF1538 domain-containing protein [Clostridia bacterium]